MQSFFRRFGSARPSPPSLVIVLLSALSSAPMNGCAKVGSDDPSGFNGSGQGNATAGSSAASGAANGSAASSGGVELGGGGAGILSAASGDGGAPSNPAPSADAGRAQVCSEAGCTCVRIASIGNDGIWGACGMYGDGTSAFETWLDTQSTATVDSYTTKPTLTAAFLAQYDVIILQWMRDVSDAGSDEALWQFSPDEVAAFQAWVQGGGGVISLSGYDGDGAEVTPLNSLLSFTDFKYNMDGIWGTNCSNCWGGACALTGWNMSSPIGAHVTQVGLQNGRSIAVAANPAYSPTVDCPCPGDAGICAVHEDIGSGHVFSYTDEWVTYTSQWLGTASCISASCAGDTPQDDFQVPQFWYNAIAYASSSTTCFVIQNPTIVPIPR